MSEPTCPDCNGPTELDEGRYWCLDEWCARSPQPPVYRSCERCCNFTTYAPTFGYLCVRCCFAENH